MKVNELHSWSEVGGGNAADNDHVTLSLWAKLGCVSHRFKFLWFFDLIQEFVNILMRNILIVC